MSADTEIVAKLKATAAVTNLCSTRIYPMVAKQDATYPYITYDLVTESRSPWSGGQIGYSHCTYSIDCVDDSLSGALSLAAAVASALEQYTATAIKHCGLREQTSEWVSLSDADDVGVYVVTQEWYVRTV